MDGLSKKANINMNAKQETKIRLLLYSSKQMK